MFRSLPGAGREKAKGPGRVPLSGEQDCGLVGGEGQQRDARDEAGRGAGSSGACGAGIRPARVRAERPRNSAKAAPGAAFNFVREEKYD